jgi:hypothetical protein
LTHNVGAIGDCFITLCRDLFILQFAANVLSSGVPLIRFHGGGFGLAVFSWLLQDVQTLTHWAVPGTDLGVFADPGTHTHLIKSLSIFSCIISLLIVCCTCPLVNIPTCRLCVEKRLAALRLMF